MMVDDGDTRRVSPGAARIASAVRVAIPVAVVLLVAAWFALDRHWISFHPRILAMGVSVLLVLLGADIFATAGRFRQRRELGRILVLTGLLIVFGGGLANWLYSLQGAVILLEGDAVPLAKGAHLQEFEGGPLSRIDELNLTLQLEKLDLVPSANGFVPSSRVRCVRATGPVAVLELRPLRSASLGSLRFHQGAFGFAPRIVILRGGKTVFDRAVPFTTERRGAAGVSFEGSFAIKKEDLVVRGAVDLSGLDARMRGHAKLGIEVLHGKKKLGGGELLPGHFSDLADGYRVGFAGLARWSEIDISRRNYPQPMLGGAVLVVCGLGAGLIARRR